MELKPQHSEPDLSGIGPTFGEWLTAREMLHCFLTRETVSLRDLFIISSETLQRNDIIPVFRQAGATNRMAMDWRLRLDMEPAFEEIDIMKYLNSDGPSFSQLYFIKRSVQPDQNTLGKNAMSLDGLVAIQNQYIGLYGWSDADILHSRITGVHLDTEGWLGTATVFPEDLFYRNRSMMAYGFWDTQKKRAEFRWSSNEIPSVKMGARLATPLSLRKS